MRIFKKFLSAVLASVMCIPATPAYAAESGGNGDYTAMLADTENGIIQFSEACMEESTASQDGYHMVMVNEDGGLDHVDNDGSTWAFSEGDEVEIELVPDDGYEISSLTVKNAETGAEMAHEDTSDNVFSFVMPAKNITIHAGFTETDAENGNGDAETVYGRVAVLQERIDALPPV